jgi:RNA polymerase sigma-70 factor (ECF subfamily)
LNATDEQLMQWYRDGDADAFNRLYARYRGPLYRYVVRQCAGCPEADELYQDVWLKVVRSRGQWKPSQPFRPWVYGIARNRVVDHWRANGRPEQPMEEGDAEDASPLQEVLAHLRDCVARLKELLNRLPHVQRDAFLLKEEGGLSLAQIAEVTGVERETVKSRLRYALKRLRQGLEGCDD